MNTPVPTVYVAEPPPAYLMRPPMVVDCSALCAILFDELMRDEALARLIGRTLHAPNLIDHEIACVAARKREHDWPPASIALALADYSAYEIDLHPVDIVAQFELAARYGITVYDAAYLWLASELRAPLATFDRKLATAAQTHLSALP